jgi:hypothetical protein
MLAGSLLTAPVPNASALTPAPAQRAAAVPVKVGFRAHRAGDQGRGGVGRRRLVFLRPVRPGLQVELAR